MGPYIKYGLKPFNNPGIIDNIYQKMTFAHLHINVLPKVSIIRYFECREEGKLFATNTFSYLKSYSSQLSLFRICYYI